jgi:CRP-like cAMP-binding protein
MIDKGLMKKIKNQGNIILNSRFLKSLSPLQRYEFLQLCHRRKYNEGEYIYYQNDPGTGMYFIESGRVQLIVENVLDESSKGELTYDLSPPESFGALSIGYDLRRMSSALCLTDCILLGFFKPDFETLKKRHPEIAVKFLETVATVAMKQLEKTTRKLVETADTHTAFSVQFSTYYGEDEKE